MVQKGGRGVEAAAWAWSPWASDIQVEIGGLEVKGGDGIGHSWGWVGCSLGRRSLGWGAAP